MCATLKIKVICWCLLCVVLCFVLCLFVCVCEFENSKFLCCCLLVCCFALLFL